MPLYYPYSKFKKTKINDALKISKSILSLPFGPYLKIQDQKKVINLMEEYINTYE